MKRLLGIITLCLTMALVQMGCGESAVVETAAETATQEGKKCCNKKDSAHCANHATKDSTAGKMACCSKKMDAKGCCAASDSSKTCMGDSATCATMKAKCNSECGTDSTVCASHMKECKKMCAAKMDSTQNSNHCLASCTNECCSGEVKTACGPSCETECCKTM